MKVVGNAFEYGSKADRFASSALFQKCTDDAGKKARVKNIGYNALRYISVLTIAPMAIALVKKHSRKGQQEDARFTLEIGDREMAFASGVVTSVDKYCLLAISPENLQYQGGKDTVKKLQVYLSEDGAPLFLARLESRQDEVGYFNLFDTSQNPIVNPHPLTKHDSHIFSLEMDLIGMIEQ